jgi:hypothetical protein
MHFRFTYASRLSVLVAVFAFHIHAQAVSGSTNAASAVWSSQNVQHAYGFPQAKPNDKGTLTVTSEAVSFTGKAERFTIQRPSVIAVSAGNQRVELWGMKGRLLRMAIPDGGGLAAAGVMQHRLDTLTVEFSDSKGGYHGAVFLLPANEAERAVESFSRMPVVQHEFPSVTCQDSTIKPKSVLVSFPDWEKSEVPAAYRVLVYEHVIDRLAHIDGISHVYRDGEDRGPGVCPQYTIHIAVTGFKQGSQVQRAVTGPVGFFVGTTQMGFDTTITDASGKLHAQEHIKAAARGESESTKVADTVAKNLAKHYSKVEKTFEQSTMVNSEGTTRLY